MALIDIPLERITETDLRRLVELGAPESRTLDFKRTTYGDRPADQVEFLKDVSSFANTLGGDIVIGVREAGGVAAEITPLSIDADAEVRRLEGWAQGGLEPRLVGFAVHAVPISGGGHVFVARARRSFVGPHRVNAHDRRRFWARAGRFKYEPDVDQLRRMFVEGPDFADRIRSFRTERLVRIAARDTPAPLTDGAKLVIHVVPVPAFGDNRLVDVVEVMVKGTHVPLPPEGYGRGNRVSANLDGFVNYLAEPHLRRRAYAQMFRNGAIEGALDLDRPTSGSGALKGPDVANAIVGSVKQYLGVLHSMEAGAPAYILVSLLEAQGLMLNYGTIGGGGYYQSGPLEPDFLKLPDVSVDLDPIMVAASVRPILNVLWNAFGVPQCDMYGSNGLWRGTA